VYAYEFGKTASYLWVFVVVASDYPGYHEAALLDPKLFSGLVHRSVALLKRRFGRRADKQPVALLAKKMIG
jgi:hypothetical protein